MSADRGRHHFAAGVGNLQRHFKLALCHLIGDGEAERERITGAGLGVVVEHEAARRRALLDPGEPVVPRHPVLHHRKGLAAVRQLIIPELSDDRKQQGGVARPFRAGLPEQFDAVGIFQGTEFGAISLDGCSNAVRLNEVPVRAHPCSAKGRCGQADARSS